MVEKLTKPKLDDFLKYLSEYKTENYKELDGLDVEEIERAIRKLENLIRVLYFRREKILRGETKKPLAEELLTVKEAAILLKVQPQTIYNNITSGKITPVRLDGTLRIKKSDILTIS